MIHDSDLSLKQAMAKYCLHPGDIVWDGAAHRFKGKNKKKKNGWYIAFPDRRGASFGEWGRLETVTWQADRSENPTKSMRARWAEVEAKQRETREAEQKAAIGRVKEVWKAASKDEKKVLAHPYLQRKEIESAEGLRITTKPEPFSEKWDLPPGTLLIPMRIDGKLVNIQSIPPDCSIKLFWPQAPAVGAACMIGGEYWNADEADRRVFVTEGWATAWSISKTVNRPVVVCFSTGGIRSVTKRFLKKHRKAEFIIAADNDRWKMVETPEGHPDIPNPGVHYATEAAKALGKKVRIAIPDFRDLEDRPTDFDDLRRQEGEESVKRWLDPGNASSACTVADPERATDQPMSSTPDPATTPSELGDVDTPARHLGDDQHSDSDPDNESAELAAKRDEALEVVRELITDGNYEQARRELDALDSDETDSEPTNLKSELENASTPKTLRRIIDREDPGGSLPVWRDWTGEPEPREWLSSLWLPAGRVALLTADGGSAKTLLALQVAAIVAAGEGFHAPGSKGPAMLPANGGAKGMAPRLSGKAGAVVFATWEDEPDEVLRRLSWLPRLPGGKSVRAAVEDRLHIVNLAGRGALWGPKGDGHRDTLATPDRYG